MEEQKYFKQAISNFTYEAACGGAIRHLADLGYTVKQIMEQLSFPVPYERVQKTVWEHFLENGILLLEEPGKGKVQEKADYVREYNKYGKASFRRVVNQEKSEETVQFKEKCFDAGKDGGFAAYLTKKCKENEMNAYVLLDFSAGDKRDGFSLKESLKVLNAHQQDYMQGIYEREKRRVYHSLDTPIRDIVIRLYESDKYHGVCYFIKTGEKVIL